MRTERVEKAVYFDTSQDDVPMTQTTGVQSEPQTDSTGVQAKAQTTSSGPQSSKTRMDGFGGTQTTNIKMTDKGTQATEDRSEEIEQLRQASELEKQALIAQHEQNIERVIQHVMAQGEAEHSRQKEGYKQEFLKQSQVNEAEAQRIINQVQHQKQQEAQHYVGNVGNVINYAEQKHLDKLREERAKTEKEENQAKRGHWKQLKKEQAKADLENYEQKWQRDEQNDQKYQNIILNIQQHHLHLIIEQNPKKQEPELHVLNIMLIIKMSKHPIIYQRLKQKPDLRLRQTYHHSLQEKKHPEVKINQKTRILNRITNLKENGVGHEILNQIQILKDHLLLKRIT